MGVDHAERVVRVVQGVDVGDREVDVGQTAGGGGVAGPVQDVRRVVDAGDVSVGDQGRQSAVMVPGPQPMSRIRMCGFSESSR